MEVDLDCVYVTYIYGDEKYCCCWFYMCLCVANEICEKLAVVGFGANMISYLTTQLHMPITKAANTLTNFGGTASLTPLIGAFVADSFIGRFWTITVASTIYQIVPTLSLSLSLLLSSCQYLQYSNIHMAKKIVHIYIYIHIYVFVYIKYKSFSGIKYEENKANNQTLRGLLKV